MDGWGNEKSGHRRLHGSVRRIEFREQVGSILIRNISTRLLRAVLQVDLESVRFTFWKAAVDSGLSRFLSGWWILARRR